MVAGTKINIQENLRCLTVMAQ